MKAKHMGTLHRLLRWVAACLFALSVAACSSACGSAGVRPTSGSSSDQRKTPCHLSFHGDTAFLPNERAWISEGLNKIDAQTHGLLSSDVVYDVDFGDTQSVVEHSGDSLLVREPEDAPLIVMADAENEAGVTTLGITANLDKVLPGFTTVKHVFLVADRLITHELFVHVVEHEALHAFGLSHVKADGAVMSTTVHSSEDPPTCIKEPDAEEICRVYACKVEDINYCGD